VPGGGVDEDGIGTGGEQGLAAIHAVIADTDGGTDAELAVGVLGGVGEHLALHDILLGDEAGELASGIDEREFFDAVRVENFERVLVAGLRRAGGQTGTRRHDGGHGRGFIVDVPHVTAGDHADEDAAGVDDRETADAFLVHEALKLAKSRFRRHAVRILDDGVFGALHTGHLLGLKVDGDVPVNDTETPFPSEGDGELGLRHGVHGGRQDRHIEADGGEFGGDIDISGQHSAVRRQKKDVVET
jgi:hypothetical protein